MVLDPPLVPCRLSAISSCHPMDDASSSGVLYFLCGVAASGSPGHGGPWRGLRVAAPGLSPLYQARWQICSPALSRRLLALWLQWGLGGRGRVLTLAPPREPAASWPAQPSVIGTRGHTLLALVSVPRKGIKYSSLLVDFPEFVILKAGLCCRPVCLPCSPRTGGITVCLSRLAQRLLGGCWVCSGPV